MKFAVRKWVRTQEMVVEKIIQELPSHPTFLKSYCAGCHAALAGQPWVAVWAGAPGSQGGAYKLCAECGKEAREEIAQHAQSGKG